MLADQAVAQSMEESGLAGKRFGTLDTGVERGKKAHEAEHPEIEVRDGQPDGPGFECLENSPGEAKDPIVRFAIGEKFVEHFGDVGEGDTALVIHGRGERRQEHVTGFEAGEVAAGTILPEGANAGCGFERSAESLA
jgi:hypothetical protein